MEAFDDVEQPIKDDRESAAGKPYFTDEHGHLFRWKETKHGRIPVPLANFTARIAEERTLDDGAEVSLRFMIAGICEGTNLPTIDIPASSFSSMNWVPQKWGTRPNIEPGQSNRDYVRHAIQLFSRNAARQTYYSHTGWRKLADGTWVFLTAGGAIGAKGVSVLLQPELSRYHLPASTEGEAEAIKASLSFLSMGKLKVTLPLWVVTYLASLTSLLQPRPNFVMYLYGTSGTFKSTLSVLQLAHFGPFTGIESLPNFDDTANSLEKRGFTLKDVLCVLDDYHPSARRTDALGKEQLAQRVIRAYSNRTGRGRLNSDSTERRRYEPRGMLQITGEEIVSLQSTLARIFVVEVNTGDIDTAALTKLQAQAHLLPHAMCSFISWVREHMGEIRASFPRQFETLREAAWRDGCHRKLPEACAFLQFTLEVVRKWLKERGCLTDDLDAIMDTCWDIFMKLAERHSDRIKQDDPVMQFENILLTLITQDKVKLISLNGQPDKGAGNLIGYFDEDHVYLLPEASLNEVRRFLRAEDSHFPFSGKTLWRMLAERGLSEKAHDGRNTIQKRFHGQVRRTVSLVGGMFKNAVTSGTGDEKSIDSAG